MKARVQQFETPEFKEFRDYVVDFEGCNLIMNRQSAHNGIGRTFVERPRNLMTFFGQKTSARIRVTNLTVPAA